ncbi:Autophagy-related protein 11 [Coccomyxa sp. Obi]|nr:Autophagy-related protein 11 [Coccomyxa sp. Obi]
MIIFIAHNGKKVELQAQASTSVEAVQRRLASLIGTPVSEQILIVNGTPLDPRQTLGIYKLPVDAVGQGGEVFMYSKVHLRANAPPPEPETLPPIVVNLPQVGQVRYEAHLLDAAASPLVAALPQYERGFRDHHAAGRAYLNAIHERLRVSVQLEEEMQVQAAAIETARGNVEHHYNYICSHFQDFMTKYTEQRRKHAEVLGRFERDMEALASVEVPAQARTPDLARLSDLVPQQRMRDWAAQCASSHQHLSDKVADVEAVFNALRADVEALFMTAPSVNLEAITHGLQDMQALVREEDNILEVLTADYGQVQKLVEEAVRQLSAAAAASSVTPLDKCQLMEQMNDNHVSQLLPRLRACDEHAAAFVQRCLDDKNQMMADVLAHLRAISGQQSKIRGLRAKLAILKEAAAKQEGATSELLLVRRIPAVYRQCLAECMRREAFGELYAGQAGQMAERMGRLRAKEVAKREDFLKHVERYLPAPLLAGMGLLSQPPHCQISVPASEAGLLKATMEDIRAVPISLTASATEAGRASAASLQLHPSASPAGAQREAAEPGEAEGEPDVAPAPGKSLEMENARLRAEIATQYAMEAARSLAGEGTPRETALPLSASQRSLPGRSGQLGSEAGSVAGDAAAAARFRAALAAKEEVEHRLETELAAARAQAASYEHRIRQLESRLLRSVARPSPSGSLRFSMRSSGTSGGTSDSAGSVQLPPVSEGAEGTSQEASLKGIASPSGTVSRSEESVSSPVSPALAGRSPGSSTEAVHRAPPVEPVATSIPGTAAAALQVEAHRSESATKVEVEKQQEAVPAPKERLKQQEQAAHGESQAEQQLVVKVASLQLGMGAGAPVAPQPVAAAERAAVAAAAEVVRSATPFAAAAQVPELQSSDSGDAPSAPATDAAAAALSHGASALPFAPSVASAMSPTPSLVIPVAPPAGLLPVATAPVKDPPGGPPSAVEGPAQDEAAPTDTAPHAKGAGSSGESPGARSRSGDSDASAEQW